MEIKNMKNGCTEPKKIRDDDSGDEKQLENTRVTINKFQPTLSYASTEITPPKGEIETIEVIDEWALIYCNDDMPVTRNTVGGYTANFHPSRTAIREEKKVEELSDSESKKFENPPAPGKKSSSGLCSSNRGIKFSFKENLDNHRNDPATKELLKPKFAPRLQPQKPFLPRKPKCKKMKPIDIKNSKLTNTLPKRSLKPSSSIIKLSYHKPRKGISSKNQVNRNSFYNRHKKSKIISLRKQPTKSKLYQSAKLKLEKKAGMKIVKEKSTNDLHVIPVMKVNCLLDDIKTPSEVSEDERQWMESSEGFKSDFLKRSSNKSLIKSNIMDSYVNSVDEHIGVANRNSFNIGNAIRSITIDGQSNKEHIRVESVSKDNIK